MLGSYIKGEPSSDFWYIHDFFSDWINNTTPDWSYFAWWENNLPLFYLFAPVVKLGSILGISDIQYSLAIFNIIMLTGTGYGIYYLIQKGIPELKNNVVVRWLALLLYMGFVPVWCSVFYVYSDSTSMFFAVTGMALYLSREKRSWLSYCLSGICIGISYLLKPTACFVILGLWLVQLILGDFKKYWKSIFICFCSSLCIIMLFHFSARFMPHQAYLDERKVPLQYWICMGMTEDGTYSTNVLSLAVPIFEMDSYTARKDFANQYIHDNIQNFFDLNRIHKKTQINFANGLFGLDEYTSDITEPFFAQDGIYYAHVKAILSPYYYIMLLLLWCAAFFMLFQKSSRVDNDLLKAIMASLIGLILFLFVWETSNRQLYNQMPWFAVGASLSINFLSDTIFSRS